MQPVSLDQTDRRILEWMQKEPGINAAELGEKIGLSQSAVWRRMQSLRDAGSSATSLSNWTARRSVSTRWYLRT